MTAARLPVTETTVLARLLERDCALPDAPSREALVLAPLLEAALYGPAREMLARPGKGFRARLCEHAFALAGGKPGALPPELPLSIEVLHAGSLIVDDIEDDSPLRRGGPTLHRLFGLPVALNAGNWLYFYPQTLVQRAGLDSDARRRALERMGACLLACHEGQALDLTVRASALSASDLPVVVDAVSARKTGALMGLAAAFGAIAAGAEATRVDTLCRFGSELGVGLQMFDDLSGVLSPRRRDKGSEDLWHDRATWVWACLAQDAQDAQHANDKACRAFGELRALARSLHEQCEEPARKRASDALIEQLGFRLHHSGPKRARERLSNALSLVVDIDGADTSALRADIDRLERSFLGGTP